MNKPLFALTMGDPSGIGPEITLKALATNNYSNIIVVGDLSVIKQTSQSLNIPATFNVVKTSGDFKTSSVNILDMGIIHPDNYTIGTTSADSGSAAYSYINKAIDLALDGQVAGVITNPINKESLKLAGIQFPGHTEIFAARTKTTDYSMLFLLDHVGVAHVTTHCSLREAIELIQYDRVYKNITLLNTAMKQLGINNPRIAVGGLNPHAGEHGLFGSEEIEKIEPAIKRACTEGIAVSGPYAPDTVFMRAFRGEFDGVVAMLHDHGFVALKSRDFEHGVNITIGLPIIRTSVGHGTAFDIAGTGKASAQSLISAIDAANVLYKNRCK